MHLIFTTFIVLIVCSSCKGKSDDFSDYLDNYVTVELPLLLDKSAVARSYYYPNGDIAEISNEFINKYICQDRLDCDHDPERFKYTYGIRLPYQDSVISVVFLKLKYGRTGDPICEFDLVDEILITYNPQGEILSQKVISKGSDCWLPHVYFFEDRIRVKQIRILEFNKPELACEIITKEYIITSEGLIVNTATEPIKKRLLIWDEQLQDLVLKKEY